MEGLSESDCLPSKAIRPSVDEVFFREVIEMDVHLQQLVRVADLIDVNADVLRSLMKERYFDNEAGGLVGVAIELERLSGVVRKIGLVE